MKQRLDHALKHKFDQIKLDEAQFAALEAKLNAAPQHLQTSQPPWYKRLKLEMIAATLAIGLGMLFTAYSYQNYQATQLAQAITSEATKNHLNLKPLEIESTEVAKVLSYFNRLNFKPLKSSRTWKDKGHKLLGGRYCSILGVDAAQLRYVSQEGSVISLYQGTLSPDKLKHLPDVTNDTPPWVRITKGMQTKIWQEQGIVFVEVKN